MIVAPLLVLVLVGVPCVRRRLSVYCQPPPYLRPLPLLPFGVDLAFCCGFVVVFVVVFLLGRCRCRLSVLSVLLCLFLFFLAFRLD